MSLNLAQPARPLERYSWVWAPVVIALALAALGSMLVSSERNFGEYHRLRKSAESWQARLNAVRSKETKAEKKLHGPSVRLLDEQIVFLNGLIDKKKLSLSGMANLALQLLPDQARLLTLSLQPSQDGSEVSFEVEGQPEAVDAFLSNLERSSGFDSPMVKDERVERQGPDRGMTVIRCLARYVGTGAGTNGTGASTDRVAGPGQGQGAE